MKIGVSSTFYHISPKCSILCQKPFQPGLPHMSQVWGTPEQDLAQRPVLSITGNKFVAPRGALTTDSQVFMSEALSTELTKVGHYFITSVV